GGRVCAFDTPGTVSQSLAPFQFSLEAADITAWAGANLGLQVNPTNYAQLQSGGVVLTQAMLDALVAFNYQNLLIPNYDADLFVFDYGVNDSQNILIQQPPNTATV